MSPADSGNDGQGETVEWSPWQHPKARRWFEELMESSHIPLMLEHAMDGSDAFSNQGQARLIMALAIMLGRDGIWPTGRETALKSIARRAHALASQSPNQSSTPLSLEQHRSQSAMLEQIAQEAEILRRRVGMSNRKTPLEPPSWGRFWS